MKIADLFCKAGGAAMGLHRAFPDAVIVGFDIAPQKRYPFRFVQADALQVDLAGFDFVWASPPCQRYCVGARRWRTELEHPHLIPRVRRKLKAAGRPYVIENVVTAREHLHNPVMLCGQRFGLGVFRHRLFETSFVVDEPRHKAHRGRIGDGRFHTVTGNAGGSSTRDGWTNGSTADWRKAMGIDWMTGAELAEAIPPAYARYIASFAA